MTHLELGKRRARELGLCHPAGGGFTSGQIYDADDIHRLLGEGIEIGAYRTDENFGNDRWKCDEYSCGRRTHKALLIGIRPIVKESREQRMEKLLVSLIDGTKGFVMDAKQFEKAVFNHACKVAVEAKALLAEEK